MDSYPRMRKDRDNIAGNLDFVRKRSSARKCIAPSKYSRDLVGNQTENG